MTIRSKTTRIVKTLETLTSHTELARKCVEQAPSYGRGLSTVKSWPTPGGRPGAEATRNPLATYFDEHRGERTLHKWVHYFDIYDRHFRKFVGKPVNVVEVGVSGGGSLDMWRHYFGDGCRMYGIDIVESCKRFENEHTSIFIGDQEDREFWRRFRNEVPKIDVFIDDGGHTAEQQIVTAEEMLPHMNPGSVYLCEDVHGRDHGFLAYAGALSDSLHCITPEYSPNGEIRGERSLFQKGVASVHTYPFVVVLELHDFPPRSFVAPKHGGGSS